MIDGSFFYNSTKNIKEPKFTDQSYDGVLLHTGMLKSGLGKLTDNDYEKNDSNPFNMSTFPFVGWNRSDFTNAYVTIMFRFTNIRKFFNVNLRTANYRPELVGLPKRIVIKFSSDGINYDGQKSINHAIKEDYNDFSTRWIMINLEEQIGNYVILNIYFVSQWIMIREILFFSGEISSLFFILSYSLPCAHLFEINSSYIIINMNGIFYILMVYVNLIPESVYHSLFLISYFLPFLTI